ncbi:MAG: capsular biosynthesis protein, partial [Minisyncoccia bacterium]
NIDVILVKHFFEPVAAGHYGVLSLLGKIIFFITGSVATVLFPTIVDRHSRNEDYSLILKYSVFLVMLGSSTMTALYFLFPKFIINFLFGASYLSVVPYLGSFGIVMALFSLINLLVVYNLSIKKTKFVTILIFGLITEVGLIYFYHDNIWQVVHTMLFSMSLILFFLLLFHYFSKSDKIK